MPDSRKRMIRFSEEQSYLIKELMVKHGEKNFSSFLRKCVADIMMEEAVVPKLAVAYNQLVEMHMKRLEREFKKYPKLFEYWKAWKNSMIEYEKFKDELVKQEFKKAEALINTKLGRKKILRKRGRPKN